MNIVIMGGGKIGQNLARRLLDSRNRVEMIERDRSRCTELANVLDIEVICGDGTEIEVLERAGIRDADIFIAITDTDADNLVAAQLAKKYFGTKKVLARANDPRNVETMRISSSRRRAPRTCSFSRPSTRAARRSARSSSRRTPRCTAGA